MLLDYWPIVTAGIGAGIWLVRLEGRVTLNDKLTETHFETLSKQVETLDAKVDKLVNHLLDSKGKPR